MSVSGHAATITIKLSLNDNDNNFKIALWSDFFFQLDDSDRFFNQSKLCFASSTVTELLGTLTKFSFGDPRHLLSIDIYFKTLISVVFTESSGTR